MNPVTILRTYLQALPRRVRLGIYATAVLVAAAAYLCGQLGVTSVGPVAVDTVRNVLAVYVLPALGLTALANLTRPDVPDVSPRTGATRRGVPARDASRDRSRPGKARVLARRGRR